MNLSPTAQATLLLTSYFGKASNEDAKPLTNVEWGRFALWLKEKETTPADLLVADSKPLLSGWHDTCISVERILQLLGRGHSLAFAVEKWQRAGLWVVTRSDPDYPRRLKSRLKTDSPPVLFGCGNKSLLNAGGLAVIGSRNASDEDLAFTQQVGVKARSQGIAIVSGGARGVDETAMLGAMNTGGNVIGIMADSLLKAATSAKWRKGLMDGNVVLASPFYPEAGFSAGNAMARNKYIYCLAESSLVIHSGKKGGTLNGAEENLKKHWVPLWVKPTKDKEAANEILVKKGGHWCESDIHALELRSLFSDASVVASKIKEEQPDIFVLREQQTELFSSQALMEQESTENIPVDAPDKSSRSKDADSNEKPVDFYQVFMGEMARLAATTVTLDELIENTGLHKSQVSDWLKRAVDEDLVKKLNCPVRYQYATDKKRVE
jgi:predicted Rossmann fold nucleotide-binding protein DprA/Smf involved in DNA uptake